jgi:hypothetical protein
MKPLKHIRKILTAGILITAAHSASAQLNYAELDTNNVRMRFYSDGSTWDIMDVNPTLHVPKDSAKGTVFASNFWIGGIDNGGQLHIGAQTYKQTGTDFWSGPLNLTTGAAANPSSWNTVWKVNMATILYHINNYTNPGYVVPSEIASWPGNGPSGFSPIMAPFMDVNGNQLYEPALGEYPVIQGDQALYFIYNDNYNTHTETGGLPMGIEVHGMAFAFDDPNDTTLSNSVFIRYRVANRSTNSYSNVQMGIWTDFDLGYYNDDFVGTDSVQNMVYAYNGDAIDGAGASPGSGEYGANPPVQGIKFMNHPMTNSMYYNNDFSATGNPSAADEYYDYMRSIWKDSTLATYGGNGYNSSSTPTDYFYAGDPVAGTGWSEVTAGNPPGDRRIIGSTTGLNLPAGGSLTLDVAYIYVRPSSGGNLAGISALRQAVSELDTFYMYNVGVEEKKYEHAVVNAYPNPNSGSASIRFDNKERESFSMLMYDLTGKVVAEQKNITSSEVSIDCSALDNGIYFVTLQSAGSRFLSKIVVAK